MTRVCLFQPFLATLLMRHFKAFVPRQPETDNTPAEVQIRDVWEGPEKYAEDYYSGGDGVLRHGQPANADFLEANGVHETIDLDEEDFEELPLPLSEARNAPEPGSTISGTFSAPDSSEQDAPLQGLRNGHAHGESLKEVEELGGAVHDDFQPRPDVSSKFLFGSHPDAEREGLPRELQDVLASPSRPTLSESEIAEVDFDLEYPDSSRPPSSARDIAANGESSLISNGKAYGAGTLVETPPLKANHSTSEPP